MLFCLDKGVCICDLQSFNLCQVHTILYHSLQKKLNMLVA